MTLTQATAKITRLQQIVNLGWQNDIDKLSRWIRCLFALALTTNMEVAEQLLDQVADIAKEVKRVCIFPL